MPAACPGTARAMTRVLLATDGSAGSLHAAAVGTRLLGSDAELVLLHVVPAIPDTAPTGRLTSGAMEPARLETAEEGRSILERAAEALGVEAERVLADGDPAVAICQVAEERDVDAIVVGARGVGPIRRALLGTVSGQVAHEATRPVLVVPNPT